MQQKLRWSKPTKRERGIVTKRKDVLLVVSGPVDAIAELCAMPTVEAHDFQLPKTHKPKNTSVILPSGLTYTITYMKETGKQYRVKENEDA